MRRLHCPESVGDVVVGVAVAVPWSLDQTEAKANSVSSTAALD